MTGRVVSKKEHSATPDAAASPSPGRPIADLDPDVVDVALELDHNNDGFMQAEERRALEARVGRMQLDKPRTPALLRDLARRLDIEDGVERIARRVLPERSTGRKPEWTIPVRYSDYSALTWEGVPTQKVAVPARLQELLDAHRDSSRPVRPSDMASFERRVLEGAAKRQVSKEQLASLTPRAAIDLAVAIAGDSLAYRLVDRDEEFLKRHGIWLPLESYLEIGQGDCDKYTTAVAWIFDYIKGQNQRLANVYVTDDAVGGSREVKGRHSWNSVVIVGSDGITVSHIDAAFDDSGGKLEGEKGYHLAADEREFLADFFEEVGAHYAAYLEQEKVYRSALARLEGIRRAQVARRLDAPKPPEAAKARGQSETARIAAELDHTARQLAHIGEKAQHNQAALELDLEALARGERVASVLVNLARLGALLGDPRVLKTVRARHARLFPLDPRQGLQQPHGDTILHYSALAADIAGDARGAQSFREQLRELYPTSRHL